MARKKAKLSKPRTPNRLRSSLSKIIRGGGGVGLDLEYRIRCIGPTVLHGRKKLPIDILGFQSMLE